MVCMVMVIIDHGDLVVMIIDHGDGGGDDDY